MTLAACSPEQGQAERAAAAPSKPVSQSMNADDPDQSLEGLGAGANRWPTRVECGGSSTSTRRIDVVNVTSVWLTLKAGDIDCYDWAGSDTPAKMTGQGVNPNESRSFTFRINPNARPMWTMGVNRGTRPLADFRGGLTGYTTSVIVVSGAGSAKAGWCRRVPLGADPARTASTTEPSLANSTMWLWSDGSTLYAVTCSHAASSGSMELRSELDDPATSEEE